MLIKLTPGLDFINILCTTFTPVAPQSVRTQVKLSVSFYAFGIYERKSCTQNFDEINTCFLVYPILLLTISKNCTLLYSRLILLGTFTKMKEDLKPVSFIFCSQIKRMFNRIIGSQILWIRCCLNLLIFSQTKTNSFTLLVSIKNDQIYILAAFLKSQGAP